MCALCGLPEGLSKPSGLKISRRGLFAATAALGAALATKTNTARAQEGMPPQPSDAKSFLIRGAHVLTMDDGIGDFDEADIHVVDGKIVAVGPNIQAEVDLVIEGSGKLVMPGFIDTHTHMWNTIWRNLDVGYQTLTDKVGPHYRPEDSHNAVRMCALEMLNSGITTVHAWEHNIRSPEHASAELDALKATGIRARYSYGYNHHMAPDQMMDTAGLLKARDQYSSDLIAFGYASRILDNDGVGPSGWPAASADVRRREWEFARNEKLPITHHVTFVTAKAEPYFELAGPDVLFVHGYQWGDDVWKRLSDAGASVSMSPYTSVYYKTAIPFEEMSAGGIPVSISFDSVSLAGKADMFRQLLVARLVTRFVGRSVKDRELLKMGTIGGAKALGIDSVTGSLTPGKSADLIVVDIDEWTLKPHGSVDRMMVGSVDGSNVTDVVVAGRFVKSNGKLTGVDVASVGNAADASLQYLLDKAAL